ADPGTGPRLSARHDDRAAAGVDGALGRVRQPDPFAMSLAGTRVDPITAWVIAGALDSIAVEMGHKLARMSYSSNLRESEDFGCVVCAEQARQLGAASQSAPLPSRPIPGHVSRLSRRVAAL